MYKMPLVKPRAFLFYNGLLLIIFYFFCEKYTFNR